MEDVGERNEKEKESEDEGRMRGARGTGGHGSGMQRGALHLHKRNRAAILHRVGAVVSSLGNLRSDLSLQVPPSPPPLSTHSIPFRYPLQRPRTSSVPLLGGTSL